MYSNIAATECADQINRKIMLSFVNMIPCDVKYFINCGLSEACLKFKQA